MITFSCGFCSRKYRVDDALAGRRVQCKECGTDLAIPALAAPVAAAKPPAVDLYGLDDEVAPPMPRRPGIVPEPASPGRTSRRKGLSEDRELQLKKLGRTFLIFGGLSFLLPFVGLQVVGLHVLGPGGQILGGVTLITLGLVLRMIARFGVVKGGLLGVGGGIGVVVLLFGLGVVYFMINPQAGPNGPGALAGPRAPGNAAPVAANPGPAEEEAQNPAAAPAPGGSTRVTILGGQAMPGDVPGGMGRAKGVTLRVDYRVESREPGVPWCNLVVNSSRGRTELVPPLTLADTGTAEITVPGLEQGDGPFEVCFEAQKFAPGGMAQVQVSDSVKLTWTDAPAHEEPPPFGNPPEFGPGAPGFRPPRMPHFPKPPIGPRFGPGRPR